MTIKYKDIICKSKKVCAICNTDCYNDGIRIIDTFICEQCIDDITLVNCEDIMYKKVKQSIKDSLVKKLKIY
jgi:hypothetical protein